VSRAALYLPELRGNNPASRGSGGTGRRTSLRGWRSQERGGSNPPFRTIARFARAGCGRAASGTRRLALRAWRQRARIPKQHSPAPADQRLHASALPFAPGASGHESLSQDISDVVTAERLARCPSFRSTLSGPCSFHSRRRSPRIRWAGQYTGPRTGRARRRPHPGQGRQGL
jgi:hypothetical protein